MKTHVVRSVENTENGQVIQMRCNKCNRILSEEFYNGSGVVQFLGVWDCVHYEWIFIGDFYLSPPQDPETKEIVSKSLTKVNVNGGKYFLLPFTS